MTGQEAWKPIDDFEGCYEVSNLGRVRSLPRSVGPTGGCGYRKVRGRLLKQGRHPQGYLVVTLSKGSKLFPKTVHKLVALAFLERPRRVSGRLEVRHLNGVKTDNGVSNLAWGSTSDNREDMRRHGTLLRGSEIKNSKLTEPQVREIRNRLRRGATQISLANKFGVCFQTINLISQSKTWRHVP